MDDEDMIVFSGDSPGSTSWFDEGIDEGVAPQVKEGSLDKSDEEVIVSLPALRTGGVDSASEIGISEDFAVILIETAIDAVVLGLSSIETGDRESAYRKFEEVWDLLFENLGLSFENEDIAVLGCLSTYKLLDRTLWSGAVYLAAETLDKYLEPLFPLLSEEATMEVARYLISKREECAFLIKEARDAALLSSILGREADIYPLDDPEEGRESRPGWRAV
ncbi:MAG: hypothetical protein QXH08_00135 [Candidatus Hadarchaeales archaeon]